MSRLLPLDRTLPRPKARMLDQFNVRTTADEGWAMPVNGKLLKASAREGYDVFLSGDQNLRHQQRVPKRSWPRFTNSRSIASPITALRIVSSFAAIIFDSMETAGGD